MTIVSAATAILCCLFSFGLAFTHLRNFNCAREQKQIVRIIITPGIFAVCCFFSVWFYDSAAWLKPIPQFYESVAFVALFYLLVVYVTPDEESREDFFENLERVKTRGRKKGQRKHNRGSLRWFYVIWTLVFAILPGRFATSIAAWVIQGAFCPFSTQLTDGQQIVLYVQSAQTIMTLMAILNFYRRLRVELKPHKVLMKLVVFKLIVLIQVLQQTIISILIAFQVIKPARTISFLDWYTGFSNFLTCCEMFIFSVAFIFPYSPSTYKAIHTPEPGQHMGFWRALLEVWNIMDILKGISFIFVAPGRLREKNKKTRTVPVSMKQRVGSLPIPQMDPDHDDERQHLQANSYDGYAYSDGYSMTQYSSSGNELSSHSHV